MPRRTTAKGELYFATLTIVDWVDLFVRRDYFDLVIEGLKHYQKEEGLEINAYVIMTSHIHLVAFSEQQSLNKLLGHYKSYTSKKIVELIQSLSFESRKDWILQIFRDNAKKVSPNQEYKVWQSGNHPVILYTEKVLAQKINYIHDNPVRAGFVHAPEDYYYSSAHPFSPLEVMPWHPSF